MSTLRSHTWSCLACLSVLAAACVGPPQSPPRVSEGDAIRGRTVLQRYDCGVCHVIPGIRGARGYVGPPLGAYARNVYVAGKYPNTPDVLVRWIMNAPALAPRTAMPALGVSEAEARDMAAYLYTLR